MIKLKLLIEGLLYSFQMRTELVQHYLERWAERLKSKTGHKIDYIKLDNGKIYINFGKVENFKKQITVQEFNNLMKLVQNLGWYFAAFTDIADHYCSFSPFDIKYINDYIINRDINKIIKEKELSIEKELQKSNPDESRIEGYRDSLEKLNRGINEKNHIAFQIEPKYGRRGGYRRNQRSFYHVSNSIHDLKIQKIGLVPKAKNKMSVHPERIYLVDNMDDALTMASYFKAENDNYREEGDKPTVYFIYRVKVPRNIPIYEDPNLGDEIYGSYITSNVPPNLIKLVKRVKEEDLDEY